MSKNKSITAFFKPSQAGSISRYENGAETPTLQSSSQPPQIHPPASSAQNLLYSQEQSSSLSELSSSLSQRKEPQNGVPSEPPASSKETARQIVKSSDDEEEDSDSSLEDLTAIFANNRSDDKATKSASTSDSLKTPTKLRYQPMSSFNTSPLPVLPKYKFDMKALISHSQQYDAAEASAKRVKAMMAPKQDAEDGSLPQGHDADQAGIAQEALLESVVAERDEEGATKVTRALNRTEATAAERRWSFFQQQERISEPERKPFPKTAAMKDWSSELKESQTRYQAFISGFVEDMVGFGKYLPDELFLWILDEACLEWNDPLRLSYFGSLSNSPEQVERLLVPELLQSLFQKLGAAPYAVNVTQKVMPASTVPKNGQKHDLDRMRYFLEFLGRNATNLQPQSRIYVQSIILRLAVDRILFDNVDLLVVVQQSFANLIRSIPEGEWETCCEELCRVAFKGIGFPTFRLRIVESILSTSSRTHELRRRLALCFFFNDMSYASSDSQETLSLDQFVKRLDDKDFDASARTDYPELRALVLLLDIAVDDGRSLQLDLSDKQVEADFNRDVDELVASIKEIMTNIGNPGAAFISRIEAKEALELISQRILDTIRTKRQPRESWFDRNRGRDEDDLEAERTGMNRFLTRMNDGGNGINGLKTS